MNHGVRHARREVVYSGLVQGVGFRYAARQIAQKYAVSGYVQNLPDGRVRVAVEGEPVELDRYLGAIEGRMRDNIRDVDVRVMPASGEFDGFDIRY